jgi:putative endonuclease
MKTYFTYIATNWTRTVLYVGVTNNLKQRIIEHYLDKGDRKKFTGRYYCHFLLYYESSRYVLNAIAREKELKGWSRIKKENLIRTMNPEMIFLNAEVFGEWPPIGARHRGR